jgi:hypothetical protein
LCSNKFSGCFAFGTNTLSPIFLAILVRSYGWFENKQWERIVVGCRMLLTLRLIGESLYAGLYGTKKLFHLVPLIVNVLAYTDYK